MVEIREEKDGYCFVVRSRQGSSLLQSVAFRSREDLAVCMRQLREHLGNPACFERRTNHKGDFQFSLKNPRGRVLGYSALYHSEAGMENGIKNTLSALSEGELPKP